MKTAIKVLLSIIVIVLLSFIIFTKKSFVLAMIIGGKFVAPEASQILCHYCFGNGDILYLKPDYFKKSPVVQEAIKNMKPGQDKIVWFHQADDWRLSYALNGFHIVKNKDHYLIYQRIVFDTSGKAYIMLNLGIIQIKVPDNIVHTFNCEPFVAVCKMKF
jgi:hypothetical protein